MMRVKILALAIALLSGLAPVQAKDLGIQGKVFEVIEVDLRVLLMEMVARHDWTPQLQSLEDSAKNYTRNLPQLYLPRAEKTLTRWKDVGIVVSEDIYLPHVDWETGSVFEPESRMVFPAGSYFNPIAHLPSAGIERLFIFDALDPDQLAMVRALLAKAVPQLHFMAIAGDVGKLSEELGRPIYYPAPTMLDRFAVRAVPTLIGFGDGAHHGHMAITEISLPAPMSVIEDAWFGLGGPRVDFGLGGRAIQQIAPQ